MQNKLFHITWWLACLLVSQKGVAASPLPDSLLTFDKAYYYNVTDMPKALQIVETMRERKMAKEWELDRAEANLLSLDRHYNQALTLYKKVLDKPEANKSWKDELSTLFLTSYCYDKLSDERHLSKLGLRMQELAEKHHSTDYLCMVEFLRGKRLYAMGKKSEGLTICEQATEDIKHQNYKYKNRMLFIFNTNLATLHMDDSKYDKARKNITNAENILRQGLHMGVKDVESRGYCTVYALKARLLAAEGREAEADLMYKKMRALPYRDISAEAIVIPYLKMRGKYTDIIESSQYCRKIIEEDGNKIGVNMLTVLKDEIDAYLALNQNQSANKCYSDLVKLTDSLHVDNLNYFSRKAHAEILHEKLLASRNLQLSIGIALLLILVLLMAAAFYHHLLTKRRTKTMMATIHELMYYRDIVLQNGDSDSVETDKNDVSAQEEKHRFKEMDKRIIKEELFRDPNFGREDLMRLMGVDKNAIAAIVQKYANTNVSGYIKVKRMEYAITLLKERPELTIAGIAEMSGIKSTTTFVNHFKETYGMTPSDFRVSITNTRPNKTIES